MSDLLLPPRLELNHLSISFGAGDQKRTVVEDVSLRIAPGESFGLIGESGCGKSTVLRALAGVNTPYEGDIIYNGREMQGRRSKAALRKMQMVFQDPYASLHPRKMVQQILNDPVSIHGLDDGPRRIREALEAVGLGESFLYRYPHELSGGQRQRVAIARCLILEPEMLLLDEPTSALDVSVQAEVLNLLKMLHIERGLTYLMVTHDLAVVSHLCSQIAMMKSGRILEVLTSDDIRHNRAQHAYTRDFISASRSPYAPAARPTTGLTT